MNSEPTQRESPNLAYPLLEPSPSHAYQFNYEEPPEVQQPRQDTIRLTPKQYYKIMSSKLTYTKWAKAVTCASYVLLFVGILSLIVTVISFLSYSDSEEETLKSLGLANTEDNRRVFKLSYLCSFGRAALFIWQGHEGVKVGKKLASHNVKRFMKRVLLAVIWHSFLFVVEAFITSRLAPYIVDLAKTAIQEE